MNAWHCQVSLSECTCRIWTSWMPMTVIRMWLSFRPQNITLRPIASCKSKEVLIEVATPTFCIYIRHVWIQGVPLNPPPAIGLTLSDLDNHIDVPVSDCDVYLHFCCWFESCHCHTLEAIPLSMSPLLSRREEFSLSVLIGIVSEQGFAGLERICSSLEAAQELSVHGRTPDNGRKDEH